MTAASWRYYYVTEDYVSRTPHAGARKVRGRNAEDAREAWERGEGEDLPEVPESDRCTVDGCTGRLKARGLCTRHYDEDLAARRAGRARLRAEPPAPAYEPDVEYYASDQWSRMEADLWGPYVQDD